MFTNLLNVKFFTNGTRPDFSATLNKRIVLNNYILVLLLASYLISYIGDLIIQTAADPFSYGVLTTMGILSLILNQGGQQYIARRVTLIMLLLIPLLFSKFYGREGGMPLILIAIIPAAFGLLETEEKLSLITFFTALLIIGLSLELTNYNIWPTHHKLPLAKQYDNSFSNFFVMVMGCFLSTFWLVRENSKTEEKLADALHKSQSNEKAKSQFLSIMSHEIRTPINGIMGLSDLLKTDQSDLQEKLEVLHEASQNLKVIVDDILDFSKIEARELPIHHNPIKTSKFITNIYKLHEANMGKKGLAFDVKIDDGFPRLFKSDPARVAQILHNLINNAFKFTDEGAVHVTLFKKGELLEFNVIDTGIGVREEDASHIFKEFQQVEMVAGRKNGGTGLGLSISQMLAELLGGKLSFKSTHGEGSTFTLKIPYIPTQEEVEDTNIELALFSGIKLLYIEDNEINRFVSQKQFERLKLDYTISHNTKDALAIIEKQPFDIILSDYHMPAQTGIDLAKLIRSNIDSPNCQTPIVLVTADISVSIDDHKTHINSIIRKPMKIHELAKCISSVLTLNKNA